MTAFIGVVAGSLLTLTTYPGNHYKASKKYHQSIDTYSSLLYLRYEIKLRMI
jgi:hypothetical protein